MSDSSSPSTLALSTYSRKVIRCVRVPIGTSLNLRVLVGALRKLPTADIRDAVQALVDELDIRCGDPDLEPEPIELDSDDEGPLADVIITGGMSKPTRRLSGRSAPHLTRFGACATKGEALMHHSPRATRCIDQPPAVRLGQSQTALAG
jgi:hypothetical protein